MVKTHSVDVLVIGAGSGLNAIPDDVKVALVEKGAMGGTCLNRGCIPSKIIIHSADIAETIMNSKKFGITSKIEDIDFSGIIKRASKIVDESSGKIEKNLRSSRNILLFKGTGKFIGNKTLKVGNNIIKAGKVIIAAGARPMIPEIAGLDKVDYITSEQALRMQKQPKTLTILGGGYIAVELAHFFGSLGTKVNIIQRSGYLLTREDEEVSKKFTDAFSKKHNILLNSEIIKAHQKGKSKFVTIKQKNKIKTIKSDELLVVMGVIPNSDILDLQKTGVKTDERGYVLVNENLETTARNIWALGDIIGSYMMKHSANYESEIAYENAILKSNRKVDYTAMPHAVFSSPQIAGAGYTEQALKKKKIPYAKGTYAYIKTGMGLALQDNEGFVKILADKRSRRILGCHIMGDNAATLMHEVLVVMRNNLPIDALMNTIHIHPALSEVVQRAANSIEW